jgi:hypothetical protein
MRPLYGLLTSTLVAALLGSCSREVRDRPAVLPSNAKPKAASGPPPPELQSVRGADPGELTQLPSGPGLLVAEPVGSTSLRTFGAGCSRWLHLVIGGEGGAGRTPLWTSVRHVAHETTKGHLRLEPGDVKLAGRCLGITHVAIGRITGNRNSGTISYQLYRADTANPVGASLSASGSRAQIVAALPRLARAMAKGIGITPEGVPSEPQETTEMLSMLGEIPWEAPATLSIAQAQRLDDLSSGRKSPLASLLFVINRRTANDENILGYAVEYAGRLAPKNLLVLGEIADCDLRQRSGAYIKQFQPTVLSIKKRFTNNQLVNIALAGLALADQDFTTGRQRAETAVRCATKNPSAWLLLSNISANQSDAIRKGKTADQVSEGHFQVLQPLYEHQLAIDLKAAECDPQHPSALTNVSTSAAFAGDEEIARKAFEAKMELEQKNPLPDLTRDFDWGLQLYNPKWYDDPKAAKKLADRAVSEAQKAGDTWSESHRLTIAFRAACLGFGDAAAKVIRTPEGRAQLAKELEEYKDQLVDPDVRVPGVR